MKPVFFETFPGTKITDVFVGDARARHVATVTCKRTGARNAVFCNETPANDDDENIIDPYGSGPVPIMPKRAV